jgi:cyclase
MRQITEHVFVETEYHWANVGAVATDKGLVLIDCPVRPSQSRHWQDALQGLGRGRIRHLIGTDFHTDHTAGVPFVDGDHVFIATRAVRDALVAIRGKSRAARQHFIDTLHDMGEPDEAIELALAEVPLPEVCFDDSMTLHLEPLTFDIRRKGGHTPACTVVHLPEEGVLFSSDIVINEPGPGLRDASLNDWIDALSWVETLPVAHVVPGHGEVCTLTEVAQLRERFEDLRGIMRNAVREGLDTQAAVADPRFDPHFWADTSRGPSWVASRKATFRKGLERVYEEARRDVAA